MTDEDSEDIEEVVSMYERDDAVAPGEASSDDQAGDDQTDTDESSPGSNLEAPTVEPGGGDLEEVTGTFYVKYAQDESVTLHEVDTAQICTLIENPGLKRHEIIEGTVKQQPPMGVSYLIEELDDQYSIPVEHSSEAPTTHVYEIATEELDEGDAIAIEREGKGEIHILNVDAEQTEDTVAELRDDETTYKNAARYSDVSRVEIRTDDDDGVVSIRYMP
ncbi:hypothetical protein SAMN05216226_106111 [Halovenus aranensis]|jgi:hypothetical protein|uniref:Uncharacterized protein n=1 Tax=Halovenus aranensis TaxID=890420 RepID=A0A1G8VAU5_9EURY|nr:DUF5812 family protein [Halovenus aranensis]SDJ63188.1 hypothetical protein SAMN05216226_106111 [Halovenus aranensis]